MEAAASRFIRELLAEEIRRVIAEAARHGSLLSPADSAEELLALYPNCGLSKSDISGRLQAAASAAGISVSLPQ